MLASSDKDTGKRALKFRTRDGLDLTADAWGPDSGPPVLMLHGGGQTRHAWGNTAERLAGSGFFAISLDARGHGDSDWDPDADYSLDAFAADLDDVAATLHEPPTVVGASLGGMTALLWEGESSRQRCVGLILVDVTPRLEAQGVQRILDFMHAHPDGFGSVEEAADAVASFLHHRPRPDDPSGLEKNLRLRENGRYYWHWDPDFLQSRKRPTTTGHFVDRLAKAAGEIRVPTLLVRGRMSDVVSPEGAREFLDLVPHAEFVDVEDAAHMVAGDRNDAFCGAVAEFLERRILGRRALGGN